MLAVPILAREEFENQAKLKGPRAVLYLINKNDGAKF